MIERIQGFYWVLDVDVWDIAYWDRGCRMWFMAGMSEPVEDSWFGEVDEQRIIRQNGDLQFGDE